MSSYLYILLPYESGISFPASEEIKCTYTPMQELKDVDTGYVNADEVQMHSGFIVINTCCRMFWLCNFDYDGRNHIRDITFEIAQAIGAKEAWYIEELITDFTDNLESYDDWITLKNDKFTECTIEYSIMELSKEHYASIIHDSFNDINKTLFDVREERGKEIFNEYLRKYKEHDYSSEEELHYISMLIESSDIYNIPNSEQIPQYKYYAPLEKAERKGGYLVMMPDPEFLDGAELDRFRRNLKKRNPKSKEEALEIEHLYTIAGTKKNQIDNCTFHWEVRT